jgi:Mn2+/Fe2+ NRAMP family transporter
MTEGRGRFRLALLLPGLLVAATGVGAGDLVTGALAGSETGTALLWAAALGALLKGGLNEGLARWQLVTGQTLLEGWINRLGRWVGFAFGAYLLLWSFVVGGALVNACAVAAMAWIPDADPEGGRLALGAAHALLGVALARAGGFALFEKLMAGAVLVMSACVFVSAAQLLPDGASLATGLVPSAPEGGTAWTLGVLGGVGGTVTLLNYGYWIREHGRRDRSALRTCRIDLAAAYTLTALFGMAMIIIGSSIQVTGSGAGVGLALGDAIGAALGPWGRGVFLAGFHAAVFSSLLGVWQGVPYLFADLMRLLKGQPRSETDLAHTPGYRGFQWALALVPLPLLSVSFVGVQKAYAVGGSLFMPFLALTLLLLTNRPVMGKDRSGLLANGLLVLTVALFAWQGLAAWT